MAGGIFVARQILLYAGNNGKIKKMHIGGLSGTGIIFYMYKFKKNLDIINICRKKF